MRLARRVLSRSPPVTPLTLPCARPACTVKVPWEAVTEISTPLPSAIEKDPVSRPRSRSAPKRLFSVVLKTRWRLATGGEGQVVLLGGEPGIGKSRLVLALREQLRAEPCTGLLFHGSPFHAHSALWPVIGQLERAISNLDGENES